MYPQSFNKDDTNNLYLFFNGSFSSLFSFKLYLKLDLIDLTPLIIIKSNEAIILSMTKEERLNPKIINPSRKKRISIGSGSDSAAINKLLKQFKMMTNMMKKMSKGGNDGEINPEIFNQTK